jgi:aminomethyltransferase
MKKEAVSGFTRMSAKTTHWSMTIARIRPGKASHENLCSRCEFNFISNESKGRDRQIDKLHPHSHSPVVSEILKLSPLDQKHRSLGGRLIPFAGWEMPVMYDSIINEHKAVRESSGVFDISHMGQLFVSGGNASKWLEGLLTNEVATLEPGNAHYTFLLNEAGGVIDDLILYRLAEEHFLLVVNASCIEQDVEWLGKHLEKGITLENESSEWAGLAVQGPRTPEIYTTITEGRTLPSRNGIDNLKHEGERLLICRTGYTGEDGFELFCPAKMASYWWTALLDEGVKPCGLGARDSLRLEMCYPLNGSDLSPVRTPLEAGLGFFVALGKGNFVGSKVLKKQKKEGVSERLMALQLNERAAPPRPGYPLLDQEGADLSVLTSGGFSPNLGEGIALAYLPVDKVKIGTPVFIEVRGKKISAKVVKKPFYRK